MVEIWTKYIKSQVFTRIKTEGTKQLQSQFPNIYFTTSSKASTTAKFPTVYVHTIAFSENEKSSDLEGATVNGVINGVQVDVIDNKSDSRALEVADVVASIMKSMGFKGKRMPFPAESGDEYRVIARYQRPIDYNDVF